MMITDDLLVECDCQEQIIVFHGQRLSDRLTARNAITISVPSTSANLGNGFDTLGIAFKTVSLFHLFHRYNPVENSNLKSI